MYLNNYNGPFIYIQNILGPLGPPFRTLIYIVPLILGHTGGGFRRNSVSDGADSLSRSPSDSSVSNPGGSTHLESNLNNANNKNMSQCNGATMQRCIGNGSSNGKMLG